METFYRTHSYLVEHTNAPVRRALMDEIDWSHRLIGIKGTRGVGKTTFLLQYAKEKFGFDRSCLFINMNNFYFSAHSIVEFAGEFVKRGGKVLLIDQVFKHPDWSHELRTCYERYPQLKIVFTGSSVMRLKDENPELNGIVKSYNLRGFSFREFLNLQTGNNFQPFSLEEILDGHEHLAKTILPHINPVNYLQDYIHHGFYPFFLEKRNFSENLLKTMNMMLEVDILYIQEIEQSYLTKIRKLFYLLAIQSPATPNVSQLSLDCGISRATVMNYMKYLQDARLINMLYKPGCGFPKKPNMVYMNNTNIMFPTKLRDVESRALNETFFYNQLNVLTKVNKSGRKSQFMVNNKYHFRIELEDKKNTKSHSHFVVVDTKQTEESNVIPLWLFGFLY